MAVYTQDDLVDRVLVRLGEVGFGQSAEPEARARVLHSVDGILDELTADRIYDFGGCAEIPGAAFDPLVSIVAARVAPDFGAGSDEVTLLAAQAQGAVQRLRRYRALNASHTYTRADYF
ncbi:hypothetical protein MKK88_05805 [Methylobacterium sp. E-005]|uniref:hypothetical protein n=1 Tax=Methylobacterium sp. E-005 TaxID=2836549 RepID=UPI001FB89D06|nr:hypothetical protein [Methylobacterium sp. E-005]MCJ2085509.1 hypothetical protein [Methylobacterium sp. E-005]